MRVMPGKHISWPARLTTFALTALAALACIGDVVEVTEPDAQPSAFRAAIEDFSAAKGLAGLGTKAYVNEQLRVRWDAGDHISIFDRNTFNREYAFQGQTGDNSGLFTKVPSEDFFAGNELDKAYAVYPYSKATSITDDGTICFILPPEQSYREHSFGKGANVMVAVTDEDDLIFKNLCGYFSIALYGEDVSVSSLSLKGNDGEPLAGPVKITSGKDILPSLQFDEAGATQEITLKMNTPIKLGASEGEATAFWFVIPPTEFSKGITLTVTSGGGAKFVKTTGSPLAIQRNVLKESDPLQVEMQSGPDPFLSSPRYLAIGFDDMRESDVTMVLPLLEKYGFHATFNAILRGPQANDWEICRYNALSGAGMEIGDHTFLHYKFPFDEPLFNGQDPANPEGGQVPFPSNQQMRGDRGDGCNAFGRSLSASVSETIGYQAPDIDCSWGELSDKDCQTIRDCFSVMKDTLSGLGTLLDELSNRYLGTTGSSRGSWSDAQGCYTGGIFTGCRTSANHEIWERIAAITRAYMEDQYGYPPYSLKTWSLPGSKASRCYFEKNGNYYYDEACTKLANNLARFTSSLAPESEAESRSWTDVLRENAYLTTNDAACPGRDDGNYARAMSIQFIFNASLSRKDALAYPTNRNIDFSAAARRYSETDFAGVDDRAAKMYSDRDLFFDEIEYIRQWTSNGVICGELIDSEDTFSERVILDEIFRYCKETGVKVISKAEADDICFNRLSEEGNLIYNPTFRNTAAEFLPTSDVPSNPDGYTGPSHVETDGDGRVLVTEGEVSYCHFGIPTGKISYSAGIKGEGLVEIRLIRNKSSKYKSDWETVATIPVSSKTEFKEYDSFFNVPDAAEGDYEQICEGLGDKVMGLQIIYSSGLSVKDLRMDKKSN